MSLSKYYVSSVGYDVVEGSLSLIVPQPRSTGIQATRRTYGADSSVLDEGRYVLLEFDLLQGATQYAALLTQFGIQNDLFNEVTVNVKDERFSWVRMNGIAVRPEVGKDVRWQRSFPRNISILIKGLFAAS